MSDNYLHLIPVSPYFVPSPSQITKVLAYLAEVLPSLSPSIEQSDNVRFFNPASNLESIRCPYCNLGLDFGWWGEAMDTAYASKFQDLTVTTPCCGLCTSLNDLIYEFPAGFARFNITFSNPGHDIDAEIVEKVVNILGSPFRKIWSHL